MLHLVRPSIKYKKSFFKAEQEFEKEGRYKERDFGEVAKNFSVLIRQLKARAKGKGLPNGYVPETIYWLVDGTKFIGRASIRHTLTEALKKEGGHIGYEIRPSERNKGYGTKILALTFAKALGLGLTKVLITCDEDNVGSRRIIEKNGGLFENKIIGREGKMKLRYWIVI